jgi:hypothetical protein
MCMASIILEGVRTHTCSWGSLTKYVRAYTEDVLPPSYVRAAYTAGQRRCTINYLRSKAEPHNSAGGKEADLDIYLSPEASRIKKAHIHLTCGCCWMVDLLYVLSRWPHVPVNVGYQDHVATGRACLSPLHWWWLSDPTSPLSITTYLARSNWMAAGGWTLTP